MVLLERDADEDRDEDLPLLLTLLFDELLRTAELLPELEDLVRTLGDDLLEVDLIDDPILLIARLPELLVITEEPLERTVVDLVLEILEDRLLLFDLVLFTEELEPDERVLLTLDPLLLPERVFLTIPDERPVFLEVLPVYLGSEPVLLLVRVTPVEVDRPVEVFVTPEPVRPVVIRVTAVLLLDRVLVPVAPEVTVPFPLLYNPELRVRVLFLFLW